MTRKPRRLSRLPAFLSRNAQLFSRLAIVKFRNRFSHSSIVSPSGPVVSLTSYGKRVSDVHLAIESIAQGQTLPSRLILWLDDALVTRNLPNALKRLEQRGLEVRLATNYGPHTKYYPYVEVTPRFDRPLVTADDDVLYPRAWLKGLTEAFTRRSDVINCYRARTISFENEGLSRYETWRMCESTEPSFQNFATGVSGVIYPPEFLNALKAAGPSFQSCCPQADDIWLHAQALRAGFKIKQITSKALDFQMLLWTQEGALQQSNVSGPNAGNDVQAAQTYSNTDLRILRELAAG